MSNFDPALPKQPFLGDGFLRRHGGFIDAFIIGGYYVSTFGIIGFVYFVNFGLAPLGNAPRTFARFAHSFIQWHHQELAWAGVLFVIGMVMLLFSGAFLLLRRRNPLLALIMFAIITPLMPTWVGVLAGFVAQAVLLFAIPVHQSFLKGWVGFVIAGISSCFSIWAESPRMYILALVAEVAMLTTALVIGLNVGNRVRYITALVDRAKQLAVERDQRAKLAVAQERTRIAREMHDIVAHSVTVMVALSEGAAQAAGSEAPQARAQAAEAMRKTAATGRDALSEMRRVLGVLRGDDAAGVTPQPGIADLPALAESFRETGLQVELSELPTIKDQGVALNVYRIVQEGLTNTLRYAGVGARVQVQVALDIEDPALVVVTVRDFGVPSGAIAPPAGQGSGRGLLGLSERMRGLGGTIKSGAAPDGVGWQLRAVIRMRNEVLNV